MVNREHMTITPAIKKRGELSTRERAREDRRTRNAKARRRNTLRKLQRASRLRRKAGRNVAKRGARAARNAVSQAARRAAIKRALGAASKAIGIIAVVAEVAIEGGRLARALGGKSGRLINAEDAHTILGDLDEQATAAASARGFIENNSTLLRIIKKEGSVNSQIASIAADFRKLELQRARGADLIERDPAFDSPDSLMDKMIKKASQAGLFGLADKTAGLLRGISGPIGGGH